MIQNKHYPTNQTYYAGKYLGGNMESEITFVLKSLYSMW
jgi:hypothetical protein